MSLAIQQRTEYEGAKLYNKIPDMENKSVKGLNYFI